MKGTGKDVIIIGAGLAGLVAAAELLASGKNVTIIDQEPEQCLGGQAFWSFGGLFFINSPEQRRMGIKDSFELAHQDWMGSAAFDRPEDHWPKLWAEAYLDFAAGEKRHWLGKLGMRFFPVVGWAERGGYSATGHGNSVPRFHVTWGTGPAVLAPFEHIVQEARKKGLVQFKFRHKVTELEVTNGAVSGVSGDILEESTIKRGERSSRTVIGHFSLKADVVILTSGGIGANHELIRKCWPERLGKAPEHMLCGVPDHVDGSMLEIATAAGCRLINPDRMCHYTEGIKI